MRIFLACLTLLILSSCSKSTAGLTIPARQAFVLGEFTDSGYSARLTNRGSESVTVTVLSKRDSAFIRSLVLKPATLERVAVGPGEFVRMTNAADRKAEVLVEMSKGVDGMRLESLDKPGLSPSPVNATVGFSLPPSPAAGEQRAADGFASKVGPGECFIVGEGSVQDYAATVRGRGESLKLRVINEATARQVMAFGLGAGSRETVKVAAGEVLLLCNEGANQLRVTVRLSETVSGGRLIKYETPAPDDSGRGLPLPLKGKF